MLPAVASSRQGDFGSRHTGSEQHLGRGPVPRQERGESAALQAPSSAEQAVSFPAPPLPLTTEEKLLLRLAHHGDPAETAMLNPANREAEEKAETAQFEQFFPPPAPPPNEVANAEAAPATPAPR
jgi:hypothetical protein